jgi:hypothetical protein
MPIVDKKLVQWFSKQARTSEAFTSIYDMLFANKSLQYIYFRLRYFKLITLVQFIFHAFLFYFLAHFSSQAHLYNIGWHWLISLVILGAWWGVLEVLRTQVREHYYAYEKDKVNLLIGRWLHVASIISLLMLAMAGYYVQQILKQYAAQQEWWVSVFTCIIWLSLAIKIWISTYHAGIYALTRILRPVSSLLVGEIVATAVFYLSWHWLQMLALPLMFLTSGIISEILRFKYCQRMYRFHEILPNIRQPIRFSLRFAWSDAWLAGSSGVFIHFSSAFLALSWLLPHNTANYNQIFLLFFLLLPLFEASVNWAQLFYFDWKKLQRINFNKLHAKYDRSILLLSPIMGGFFWCLASAIGWLLLPQFSWTVMWLLLPIMLLRSVIAYKQIKAFANFYYFDVIISGLIISLGLALAYYLADQWQHALLSLLGSMCVSLYWLWSPRLPACDSLATMRKHISFYDWLNLACHAVPTQRIYQLSFSDKLSGSKQRQILAHIIQRFVGEQGRVCYLDKYKLLILQPESSSQPGLPADALVKLGAGFLTGYEHSGLLSGASIATHIVKQVLKYNPQARPNLCADFSALKQAFLAQNSEGQFFGPEQELASKAKPMQTKTMQKLMSSLRTILFGHIEQKNQDYELLPIYLDNSLIGVFALPIKGQKKKNEYWKNLVHDFNLVNILPYSHKT